ncbi:MAG TPA: surface-adhesin E family protein [Nitrospira sp.]|nr:surface-adhesin E family protein [Nitrospira sp.]
MTPVFWVGLRTILLLTWLSGGSSAAEWVPIDGTYQSPGLRTVYIDSASVRREQSLVTLSVLIDWKWMQGGRSPTRFSSTMFTKQIDCSGKRVRSLAATDFYGPMGTGVATPGIGYTSESVWTEIEPDSLSQGVGEMVCGKQ